MNLFTRLHNIWKLGEFDYEKEKIFSTQEFVNLIMKEKKAQIIKRKRDIVGDFIKEK